MTSKHALKTALAALAVTATLGLAGCGTDDTAQPGGTGMDHSSSAAPSSTSSASASVSAVFNEADVTFAQMMIPHHEQAVAMSDTLLGKSGVNPDVAALARMIKTAQQPEIDTMKSWLTAWGEDMGNGDSMGGMNHGSGDGMATDAELEDLQQAGGADAQRMYLEMMIAHHEGAIAMAKTEVMDGENPEATELAQRIARSQQNEIAVMQDLLSKL